MVHFFLVVLVVVVVVPRGLRTAQKQNYRAEQAQTRTAPYRPVLPCTAPYWPAPPRTAPYRENFARPAAGPKVLSENFARPAAGPKVLSEKIARPAAGQKYLAKIRSACGRPTST